MCFVIKILIWNVREAKKLSFLSIYDRFLQLNNPHICVFLETRLSGPSLDCMRRRVPRDWRFFSVPSQGLSGGIIVV